MPIRAQILFLATALGLATIADFMARFFAARERRTAAARPPGSSNERALPASRRLSR